MKRSVAKSQLSLAVFVGLALLVANNIVACGGDSTATNTPDDGTAGSRSGTTGSPSGQTSNGGGSATSEGNPVAVLTDPNRDPTVPVNLVASGAVQCGGAGNYCIAPDLTCCTVPGAMGMGNSSSCAANVAACPTGTTTTVACSSKASCSSGQVCCRTGGGGGGMMGATTTSCEASCATGSVQVCLADAECGAGNQCNNNGTCGPIPCTATSCSGGQLCCRAAGGGGAQPACVAAGGDGLCPNNQRQVCAAATDCPAGNTCAALGGGGGNGGGLVCTPPACTTTSCTGGQICCVGGQVGGTPTCSAANAGACPGNSRFLCTTDTDCAPAVGTLCLTAPNGGGNGQLSCRVPPPPPADAGVVADAGG